MKIPAFLLLASVIASPAVLAAPATSPTTVPVTIKDVPRNTQAGTKPPPGSKPGGKYLPPVPAKSQLPTLWLIGDSTVRNGSTGDNGPTGQWGWGAPIVAFFNPTKINVVNRALGGTSSRSFYTGDLWKNIVPLLKKGDFVMMQFGANDNGGAKGKGGLSGIGAETETVTKDGKTETVHSFGWYLQQFVTEARAKGATPIICSLTPRKGWTPDGHFARNRGAHAAWAGEVAKQMNVPFVDLNELISQKYESLGAQTVDTLYVPSPKENLHTGWDGAAVNAECVIAGLKALPNDPLAPYLSPRAEKIAAVDPAAAAH